MKSFLSIAWIIAVTFCLVSVFAVVLFMINSYQNDFSRVAYFMSRARPAPSGGVSPFWQAVLLVLIATIPASIFSGIFKDFTKRRKNKEKVEFASIGVWVTTYLAAAIVVIAIYT
jgi:hypothetical protein